MAKTKIHGEYLDPSVISGQTQVTAVGADSMLIFDATDNALKKALLSDLIETVGSTPSFTSATISGDLTVDTSTLKVDSSNNRVGILTSSPANLLHIEGSAATVSATQLTLESRFTGYGAGIDFVSRTSNGGTRVSMAKITADGENSFSTTTSTQDAGLRFFTTNSGTQAERMRIDTAGTLYLGTTSPTLHSATGGIVFTNGSLLTDIPRAASRSINLAQNAAVDSGNTWAYLVTDEASLFQQFGGNHYFKTAASGSAGADITFDTKMFIANAGNVGIKQTSPTSLLHLGSSSDSGCQVLGIQYDSRFYTINTDSGHLLFKDESAASERMRLTSGGSLLIGRTTQLQSDNMLSVQGSGTGAGNAIMDIRNTASSDTCGCIALSKASTTTDSSARFIWFFSNNFSTSMGAIGGNGANNVQFVTASDERLKENIKPLTGSLDKVLALNPVSYTWKESGEDIKAGFVAQEVEKILPEYTATEEDEMKTKSLTGGMTAGYIAVLTKAIQEQQEQIEALQSEINILKGE